MDGTIYRVQPRSGHRGGGGRQFHLFDTDMGRSFCGYVKEEDLSGAIRGGMKMKFTGLEDSQKPESKFCGTCIRRYQNRENSYD